MSVHSQLAYTKWKNQHIVDMQVHTDEQMFTIGFEEGQKLIMELSELIFEMEKENKRLDAMVKKLKKAAKDA